MNLNGAVIVNGVKLKRLIARATRICDGYEGLLFLTETNEAFGLFGCRATSLKDFRNHVDGYSLDDPCRAETLAICDFFENAYERETA